MSKGKKSTDKLKHYLRSAWYWAKKKDLLSAKIMVLRSRAEKMTTTFSDVPASGGFADHRQAVIDEIIDTERKYAEARLECEQKLQEIQFFINCLDGYEQDYQERLVLEYRYIHFTNWQDIAYKLNYHERAIYKVHGRALLHLLEVHKKIIEQGHKKLF